MQRALYLFTLATLLSTTQGCVVVTGATGFVAGHIVEVLLEKGYTVHGTVRDVNSPKCDFLRGLNESYPGNLHLFAADLRADRPFDAAMKGCSKLLHVASVVVNDGMSNAEQVQTAVKGTVSALEAALAEGVKDVVVTSSTATVQPTKAKIAAKNAPYTIEDVNDVATEDYGTYAYSKVLAEKAGDEFMAKHNNPFRLATIHFPFALGPQQNARVTSSNSVLQHLLRGELPYFIVPMQLNIIDVRDVARGHVHVLESPTAKGRFLIATDPKVSSMSLGEIAQFLLDKYPSYPIATRMLPEFMLDYLPLVEKRLHKYDMDGFKRGRHPGYDGSRISKELGFEYKYPDPKQSILDGAESMIHYKVADGNAHPMPIFTYIALGLAGLLLLVLALISGLFSSKPVKTKDE